MISYSIHVPSALMTRQSAYKFLQIGREARSNDAKQLTSLHGFLRRQCRLHVAGGLLLPRDLIQGDPASYTSTRFPASFSAPLTLVSVLRLLSLCSWPVAACFS